MTKPAGPNTALIGQAGSRRRLATPALVLDLDLFDANKARMARFCAAQKISLRPHAKSHKSVEIGRQQMAAGAVGVCCATLGEAEAMAAAGIAGVLVTSPVAGDTKIARLAALAARTPDLMAVADHPQSVSALSEAMPQTAPLKVLVDVDIGHGRTGVADTAAAVDLARRIDGADKLQFAGVQAYGGHLQHMADAAVRAAATVGAAERLRAVIGALRAVGLDPAIVTGAGTGTYETDAALGLYTELQAGSYIFMDVQYADPGLWPHGEPPFEPALFVQSTVVSANHPGYVTTDAGLKAFATDGPAPLIARGAPDGAAYSFSGDEFGRVSLPRGGALPLGAVVDCMVPHCDPTVNLHDHYHCVRGDTLVDIWPIGARGKY